MYLIDVATRFTVAEVLSSKTKEAIIEAILSKWVGMGPGLPKKFLSDNGGEFNNAEYTDMCENLNIVECKTAAESPWSNGLCERNHAVVDRIISKMLEEYPSRNLATCVIWACHAKNCLQMHGGFSPYQLVFGRNPNLPSVLVDDIPALEGSTISETVGKHINTLHASRKAFIAAETCEKIRRALKHQIRTISCKFETNDSVFYKRNDSDKWKGPGKVLGSDKNVVYIRHGSNFVRVHPCRVILAKGLPMEPISGTQTPGAIAENPEIIASGRAEAQNMEEEENNHEKPHFDPEIEVEEVSEPGQSDIVSPITTDEIGMRQKALPEIQDVQRELSSEESRKEFTKPQPRTSIMFKKRGEDQWKPAKVESYAGKQSGKHKDWLNISDGSGKYAIDWKKDVDDWKYPAEFQNELTETHFIGFTDESVQDEDIKRAKEAEYSKWQKYEVFEPVNDEGQPRITVKWVITSSEVDSQRKIKARLVARGFEETSDIQVDSPTAQKASIKLFLVILSWKNWIPNAIDVQAAFLQGKTIDRNVFLKPPPEFREAHKLWHLKKCVYGLSSVQMRSFFLLVQQK